MEDLLLQYFGDISEQISRFGPIAILFLLILPLGEELVLIPAGMLVGHGSLPFWATWLCGYLGVLISDAVWFLIARHYGTPLLHKRWFKRFAHPRRLLQAKHQIERRGAWVVISARFLPGSRTAALIMAGMLHMPVWKYFLAEGSLAFFTVLLQLSLGMLIAHGIGTESTARIILGAIAVVVIIVASSAAVRWIVAHRRSGIPAPRARASWLRRFRRPRKPSAAPVAGGKASTDQASTTTTPVAVNPPRGS